MINQIRDTNIPLILLGSGGDSGGEHSSNSARTFASCAYAALGLTGTMPEKVPSSDRYTKDYQSYGDGNLIVSASNMNSEVLKGYFIARVRFFVEAIYFPRLIGLKFIPPETKK